MSTWDARDYYDVSDVNEAILKERLDPIVAPGALAAANAAAVALGEGPSSPPNRSTLNTQTEITADFSQRSQGGALVAKPTTPIAGIDSALISWYKGA